MAIPSIVNEVCVFQKTVLRWQCLRLGRYHPVIPVILNGNVNTRRYIDYVLRPVALPILRQNHRRGNFMHQVNAPAHAARLTVNFLAANTIQVLDWPSLSQDISQIEHIWDKLGRRIRARRQLTLATCCNLRF